MAANFGVFFDSLIGLLSVIGFVSTVIGMIVWTHFLVSEFFEESGLDKDFSSGLQWMLAICIVLSTAGVGLTQFVQIYGLLFPLLEIIFGVIGGGVSLLSVGKLCLWFLGNL